MPSVPSIETIATEFARNIEKNCPRSKSRKAWTRAIKKTLIAVGKNEHYETWPSNPATSEDEFLTDVGWYYGGGRKDEYGLALVAESELEPNRWKEIDLDFDKILHIKAPRKVFVFRTQAGKNHRESHKSICGFLNSYKSCLVGEEFLFVEFESLRSPDPKMYIYKYVDGTFSPVGIRATRNIRVGGICGEADQFPQDLH
jgi:hypothetical protein